MARPDAQMRPSPFAVQVEPVPNPADAEDAATSHRTYRAYTLDRQGKIRSATVLKAATDAQAKALAAAMVNGHGIDLWERERFLGSFPPLEEVAP